MPDPHQPAAEPGGAGGAPSASGGQSNADLIQSMLSRAVEGQVSEQREMSTALGEIRSQLLRMSQELAQMRMRAQDDTTDAQVNTVTVEMREAVRFLSERLDGVTRMVAQRGEDLADIRTALTAIDAHVRSQAETIGVLSGGLQALPSYGERVSALQDNLQALHQQLAGIEQTLAAGPSDQGNDEIANRLAALESSLGSLVESTQSTHAAVAPVVERLNSMDDGGETQAAVLAQVQSSAAQLQQAVAGLHNRIDPLADDISTIGAEIAGLVESAADGAVLDSRITESVNEAVRGTEQRLMEHVDEAVLALAQTLLRARGAGASTFGAETAGAEPSAGEPSEHGHGAGGFTTEPAAQGQTATSAGSGGTTWWERDLDDDAADIEAAADSTVPGTSDPSEADDLVPEHWWEDNDDADEAAVTAEEPARSNALDTDDADHDEALGDIDDLYDTVDLDGIRGLDDVDDGDAADTGGTEPSSTGYAISASGHATEAWTKDPPAFSEPEAEEPPAEETAKSKRRWGRRNR
jgi:hypothetical protein